MYERRRVSEIEDGLAARAGAEGGEGPQLDRFVDEAGRAVAEQAVGAWAVLAADVVLESRGPVDGEGHVEDIAAIDPLAVQPAAVLGDDERVGRAVGDHGDA